MASVEREPITGYGGRSPNGIQVQPLVGVIGQSPSEAESLLSIFIQKKVQKLMTPVSQAEWQTVLCSGSHDASKLLVSEGPPGTPLPRSATGLLVDVTSWWHQRVAEDVSSETGA